MVGRAVRFTAAPGRGEDLATQMLDIARSLAGTDGCRLYTVSREVGAAETVWVTELWETQEAVDASLAVLQTDAGRTRLSAVMALLAGPPERTDLEPLGGVGAE